MYFNFVDLKCYLTVNVHIMGHYTICKNLKKAGLVSKWLTYMLISK